VFDTWFSSGQWPFAALMAAGHQSGSNAKFSAQGGSASGGKIQNAKLKSDFKTFYPTDVMETGYDILFFWVARMIMLGIYATGKVPFKTVYLHGLVRDKDRQKMSKSKGNVIDPLGMVALYGADAVRMALLAGTAPGNDPVLSEEKIRGYRNFATKLWNIARFILSVRDTDPNPRISPPLAGSRQPETYLKSMAGHPNLQTGIHTRRLTARPPSHQAQSLLPAGLLGQPARAHQGNLGAAVGRFAAHRARPQVRDRPGAVGVQLVQKG